MSKKGDFLGVCYMCGKKCPLDQATCDECRKKYGSPDPYEVEKCH